MEMAHTPPSHLDVLYVESTFNKIINHILQDIVEYITHIIVDNEWRQESCPCLWLNCLLVGWKTTGLRWSSLCVMIHGYDCKLSLSIIYIINNIVILILLLK